MFMSRTILPSAWGHDLVGEIIALWDCNSPNIYACILSESGSLFKFKIISCPRLLFKVSGKLYI